MDCVPRTRQKATDKPPQLLIHYEYEYCLSFLSFFFPSHVLSSPFFPLSLLVVTQIRGHIDIAGSSLPSPQRFVPCIIIAARLQLFLPSSTRIALCLPTLGALSRYFLFLFFLQISSKYHHGGIRNPGPTLSIAFERNHY